MDDLGIRQRLVVRLVYTCHLGLVQRALRPVLPLYPSYNAYVGQNRAKKSNSLRDRALRLCELRMLPTIDVGRPVLTPL